jgi:hypothetical protein
MGDLPGSPSVAPYTTFLHASGMREIAGPGGSRWTNTLIYFSVGKKKKNHYKLVSHHTRIGVCILFPGGPIFL